MTSSLFIKSALITIAFSSQALAVDLTNAKLTFFNKQILEKITIAPECKSYNIGDAKKVSMISDIESSSLILAGGDSSATAYYVFKSADPNDIATIRNNLSRQFDSSCKAYLAANQQRTDSANAAKASAVAANTAAGGGGGSGGGVSPKNLGSVVKDGVKLAENYDKAKDKEAKSKSSGILSSNTNNSSSQNTEASKVPKLNANVDISKNSNSTVSADYERSSNGFGTDYYTGANGGQVSVSHNLDGSIKVESYNNNGNLIDSKTLPVGSNPSATVNSLGAKANEPQVSADGAAQINEIKSKSDVEAPVAAAAAKEIPPGDAANTASTIVQPGAAIAATATDSIAKARAAAELTNSQSFNAVVDPAVAKALVESAAPLPNGETCLEQVQAIEAALKTYQAKKEICLANARTADNLCSYLRSPSMILVQGLMSLGTAVLSKVTAASESCGVTSSLSKVAQFGTITAQLVCTAAKVRCDFTCPSAASAMAGVETTSKALVACSQAIKASTAVSPLTAPIIEKYALTLDLTTATIEGAMKKEQAPLSGALPDAPTNVVGAIAQCGKHAADIVLMGTQVLGLSSAFADAKSCKQKLSAGAASTSATGNDGTSVVTTAEFCASAENASSLTCKCTVNPQAEGCLNAIANGSGIAIGKVATGGTTSSFASAGGGGAPGAKDSASNFGKDSTESASGTLAALNNSGGGFGSGGGSAGSSSGGAKDAAAGGSGSSELGGGKNGEPKSKFNFSFGGLASSIGGFFGGGKKAPGISQSRQSEIQEGVKRKLASDQVRSEVSSASGKSNFDKVTDRYKFSNDSFIGGQ